MQSAGATLLTLGKYTNFNTLNVLGLEGEDSFVSVAPSGPSHNVFIEGGAASARRSRPTT